MIAKKLSVGLGELSVNPTSEDLTNARALSEKYAIVSAVPQNVLAMFLVEKRIQRIRDKFRQYIYDEIISQLTTNGDIEGNVDERLKPYAEAFILVTSITTTDFDKYQVLAGHCSNQYEVYNYHNSSKESVLLKKMTS